MLVGSRLIALDFHPQRSLNLKLHIEVTGIFGLLWYMSSQPEKNLQTNICTIILKRAKKTPFLEDQYSAFA